MITIPKRFKKLVAGDYICKIKAVKIAPNRNGESCLWLSLDIDEGPYKGYFETIYQNRKNRINNNYPCVYCQNMSNYSVRFFQSLLNTIIASNPTYQSTCKSGQEWNEQELVGLLCGVTFSEHKFVNARGKDQINLVPTKFKDIHLIQKNNNIEKNDNILTNDEVNTLLNTNNEEINITNEIIIEENEK